MNIRFLRFTGVLLLVITAIALAGCGGQQPPTTADPAAATVQPTGDIPAVKADNSIMAEGRVVPVRDATLSFITGGVVGKVLVTEGDIVTEGQPLIQLVGNEQLEASVAAAELEVLSAEQALNDLNDNLEVERSKAALTLAQAEKELDKAKKRMLSKDWQRGSQPQVDIARANYIIAEDGVSQAEEIYDRFDDRPQDDPMRAEMFSQLAAAKQVRDKALANLNYLLAKPNKLDMDEANANLSVAQANVNEAVRRLNLLKDGPDANQIALAEARLKNARLSKEAAVANLEDLELRSPFAGTITSIDIGAGEFATPGTAVAQIADLSVWHVETTDLTELNVSQIKMGQPAMVRFDALEGVDVIGRVTRIKALGENRQGDIVYTVTLKLDPTDAPLHWNMTASVTFLEKESQ